MSEPIGTPLQLAIATNDAKGGTLNLEAADNCVIVVAIQGGDGDPVGDEVEAVIASVPYPGVLVDRQEGTNSDTLEPSHTVEHWAIPIGNVAAPVAATISVALVASTEWGGCAIQLEDTDQENPDRASAKLGGFLAVGVTTSSVEVVSEVGDCIIDVLSNNSTNVFAPESEQSLLRSAQESDAHTVGWLPGEAGTTVSAWSNLGANASRAHLAVAYQSPDGGGDPDPDPIAGASPGTSDDTGTITARVQITGVSEGTPSDGAAASLRYAIMGTCSDSEGPLEGVLLYLIDEATDEVIDTALSGADGAYQFTDVAPGTYHISPSHSGGRAEAVSGVVIGGG